MEYKIEKKRNGKYVVQYKCPRCSSDLESPLKEAGIEFSCAFCSNTIKTPGENELQRMNIEDLMKSQMVENKREEQARQEGVPKKDSIKKDLKPQRTEINRSFRRIIHSDLADLILGIAFKFAKGVSVLVVVSCFVTIIVCTILFVMTRPKESTFIAPTFQVPGQQDYVEYRRPYTYGQKGDASESASSVQSPKSSESLDEKYNRILRKHSIDSSDMRYQFFNLDREIRQQVVDGLEAFLAELRNPRDMVAAVEWYLEISQRRWKEIQWEISEDEANKRGAVIASTERRQQLGMTIGSSFIALLGFLFLPLLIQIERNTRLNLKFQTEIGRLVSVSSNAISPSNQ